VEFVVAIEHGVEAGAPAVYDVSGRRQICSLKVRTSLGAYRFPFRIEGGREQGGGASPVPALHPGLTAPPRRPSMI
jgi:hypothetical protein